MAAFEPLEPSFRRGDIEEPGDPVGHFVERGHAQCPADSPFGGQQIGEHGQVMPFDGPEQQGRPTRLGHPSGDFGHSQRRIDLLLHAGQFPGVPKFFQKVGQAAVRHGRIVRAEGGGRKAERQEARIRLPPRLPSALTMASK